uniref:Uncharacterized protein n=1 Tax=Vespula pensylvanica TaxID=30213 RepID=A0A834NDM6_VESPE|nr:hypothetical protein H0235_014918 [Vespula pensylvanica]
MRLAVESNKWLTTYHGHEKKGSKDVDTCRDLRSRNYGYAVSVTIQAERSHAPIISLARSSISSLGYTIGVNSCGRLQLGTGFRAARIIHDWVVPDEFERQDNLLILILLLQQRPGTDPLEELNPFSGERTPTAYPLRLACTYT